MENLFPLFNKEPEKDNEFSKWRISMTLNLKEYAERARQVAADGCVLLKNDNQTLPLRKGDKVAVFGRIAFDYYKSGLGSGGLVNTRYTVGILDALQKEDSISVNEKVLEMYREWIKENPYDVGQGWGQVPWSQKEMPVTEALLEASKESDVAVIVIGRTAGEDQDNKEEEGSYLLQKEEKLLIKQVSAQFPRTVVLLNVGNIIDMKWVEEYDPAAVMYVWQGGQEGGNGVADVLTGRVSPSGHLTDTIARNISDYPSSPYFGGIEKNYYVEDIYVGYRYFETFAKEKVLYPFGYGLSYTEFAIDGSLKSSDGDNISIDVLVENTGEAAGRQAVQIYISAPQGRLGKPARVLAGFQKTKELDTGEKQELHFEIAKYVFSSYDDSNAAGHKSCYLLEKGIYEVYVGADVRSAQCVGSFEEKETRVVEELEEAYAPIEKMERMKPSQDICEIMKEAVPMRTIDWHMKRQKKMPCEIAYTGNQGIKLADVYSGKATMEDFIAQLSDEELIYLFRGEGMCSPKVTPGTGAAFGGLTHSLRELGIPAACCTDGPSGIRMDVGTKAFSLPNGAAIASTFDLQLIESLYQMTGRELRLNRIDALLGPGMNIHRHPLNGRNFEYFSEDPLLTGKMGAAMIQGMNISGSTGVIKHFCGNNQETNRRKVESVVSERALREIYLKGFEIAVKEGKARAVMTTYGPVNGLWTAGSYDLNSAILREEWKFDGIVMTDWWAEGNEEGEKSSMTCHAAMAIAQNDLYMTCSDCTDMNQDDMLEKLQKGVLCRSELQRNARNILQFILQSPAMLYEMNMIPQEEIDYQKQIQAEEGQAGELVYYHSDENDCITIDCTQLDLKQRDSFVFGMQEEKMGYFDLSVRIRSNTGELAQLPITVSLDNVPKFTISFRGTNGKSVTEKRDLGMILGTNHYVKLYVGANGINLEQVCIQLREEVILK